MLSIADDLVDDGLKCTYLPAPTSMCTHEVTLGLSGTYMQGVAFRQADGKVVVETSSDDSARIKGKHLKIHWYCHAYPA